MTRNEWPYVDEAVAALAVEFEGTHVANMGGPYHAIAIPRGERMILIGDYDGPLGESGGMGWSAEITDNEGEAETILLLENREDIAALIAAIRAFELDGKKTGLPGQNEHTEARDIHHDETGHYVNTYTLGDETCAECQEIHAALKASRASAS